MKNFSIKASENLTLNELLRRKLPALLGQELSNSKIRRLIVAGGVCVNGKQMRVPSFFVREKSLVSVVIDEEKFFYEKKPDDIAYELTEKDILFEDESIIVVNKPSHFPTEAGMVGSRDNLHAAVVRFLFERQKITSPNAKNPPYVGIMHRLDRDTSGVILFTKTRAVNSACHEMFEKHTARKEYVAAVSKMPSKEKFSVEFFMNRISPKGQAAKWGKVAPEVGEKSLTNFEVFRKSGENAFHLVLCYPLTGRTHQIRVHLASEGCPILGDELYGGKTFERIMLHAKSLTFPHPVSGKEMKVEAPLPEEFGANI